MAERQHLSDQYGWQGRTLPRTRHHNITDELRGLLEHCWLHLFQVVHQAIDGEVLRMILGGTERRQRVEGLVVFGLRQECLNSRVN